MLARARGDNMGRGSKGVILGVAAAASLALAACNPVAKINGGESQVERFHAAYGRGDRDALYAMTGPQFRATTTRPQFDSLIDVVSVRLGPVRSSERTGFNVNTTTSGTYTTIVMTTHFAKGDGEENFVFTGDGDAMILEGWHVTSPNLMLTADDVADERASDAAGEPPDKSRPPEFVGMAPRKGSN